MWDSFIFAFNVITPMLLLMSLGYWLKHKGIFEGETLKKTNNFAFKYSLSCLAFNNVYKLKNIDAIPFVSVLLVLVILVGITLLGVLSAKILTNDSRIQGVLVQNSFRSNYNVIGIPLATQLGGAAGAGLGAALMAPVVMYYNVVSVLALTYYGQKGTGKVSIKKVCLGVVKNPLIIALSLGVLCLLIRSLEPIGLDGTPIFLLNRDLPWFYTFIVDVGKIAPSLLLVLLGSSISFAQIGDIKGILTFSVLQRLCLAPLLGFAAVFLASKIGIVPFSAPLVACLVGVFASPATPVSAIMAEDAGCNGALAAQCVVWSTTCSIFTMMFIIMLLRMVGFI